MPSREVDEESIARFLASKGEPTEAPPREVASDPNGEKAFQVVVGKRLSEFDAAWKRWALSLTRG